MKEEIKNLRIKIPEFNYYQIDLEGNVYSLNRLVKSRNAFRETGEKKLKPNKDKNGYLYVVLQENKNKKTMKIHRLVAKTFLNNPLNLPQVNHIDGNKQNNNISNLEWCDCQTNIKHAYNSGLKVTKLTKLEAIKIRELITIMPQKEIALLYNVHNSTISNINKNKTHGTNN